MEDLKKAQTNVLNLDAGNALFPYQGPGMMITDDLKKRAGLMARGIAAMKTDVVNVGGQDLAGGLDFLVNTLAKPEGAEPLPLISANLQKKDTGEMPFPPNKIITIGDLQVGVFGLIAPAGITAPGLAAKDPTTVAKQMVQELRSKCDLVIALYDGNYTDASRLAGEVPGIDLLIVSDRAGEPRPQPLAVKNSLLVQAGNRGMYIGRLELTVTGQVAAGLSAAEQSSIETDISRLEAQKVILQGQIQSDPMFQQKFLETQNQLTALQKKLEGARLPLTYQSTLISMDAELPEDPAVADWLTKSGIPKPVGEGKPQPATPAQHAPRPAPTHK